MSDVISRQDAIDAIYHHMPNKTMDECRAMLHDVPSAQPDGDLVNRQDVVEVIYNALRKPAPDYKIDPFHDSMGLAVAMAQNIPSAQQEPNRQARTCDGCKFVGTYDTDFPCCGCIRREKDYYAQEG